MAKSKRKPVTGINPRLFAQAATGGASLEEANLRAGYSATSAKRGWACASKACKTEYAKMLNMQLAQLEETGGKLTPEQRSKIVRGKLLKNVAEGKDESTASLKMLGADRELSMWQPESVTGVVIIEAPHSLPALSNKPCRCALPDLHPDHGYAPDFCLTCCGTVRTGTAPQLPTITLNDEQQDAVLRGRFFSPEDQAWCSSPEGQEVRRRLQARGEL